MRVVAAALAAFLLVAATPGETIPELETQGFFIETGSDADPAAVSDAVAEARFAGGKLFVVVLATEPPGGATTFSDAVLDDLGIGTVFTVAPVTIGYSFADDIWTIEELDRATDAAADGASDTEVVEIFIATLTTESSSGESSSAGSGGGSPWTILIIGLVIAGGIAGVVWWTRQQKRARRAQQLGKMQAAVRAKVDDVANDIIDMEDEVRTSENAEAETYYEEASSTYADVLGRTERARELEELVELSNELDEAIWQLDSAEALLDGKPPPPKPAPVKLEPPTAPADAAAPATEAGSGYVRRSSRRSSYGGPALGRTMMTMMAMGAMSGRRRRRSYGSSRRSSTRSSSRRSSVGRRGRGGTRRRG